MGKAKAEAEAKKKEEAEAAKETQGEKGATESSEEKKTDNEEKADKPDEAQKGEEEKKAEEPEKPKAKTVVTVDEVARAAFSWFDIPNPVQRGVYRRAHAEHMLHGTGTRTIREVEELVSGIFQTMLAWDESSLTQTVTEVPIDEE